MRENDSLGAIDAHNEAASQVTAERRLLVNDRETPDYGSVDKSSQAGVRAIEAISSNWSGLGLIVAYVSLLTVANVTSLESQTTSILVPFATSSFSAHSLLSTVAVVQGAVNAVIKPPLSKVADVIGRFEAFSLAILIFVIGYIQEAASDNVKTYAAAQIFYSAGSQGLQILQQIFVADTTDLLHRAIFITLFNVPFLWTVWAGSPLAQCILDHTTWRWGYGIWAIALPIAFLPLAIVLFTNKQKAKRKGQLPPSLFRGKTRWVIVKKLWFDLDVFGLMLLSAAIFLILIPLTLAASAQGGWQNSSILSMLVVGVTCLAIFPFWERSETLAPHAFLPSNLFANRSVIAGVAIAFFYFMAFYLSIFPYFSSYLLIVQGLSVTAAGRIAQVFSFSATITAIIVSLLIKYTAQYKYLILLGSCVYVVGLCLLVHFRQPGSGIGTLVGCQIAVGIGGGMLTLPTQLGVQASVSHQQVAAATAAFLTILEIGGAVGSAISGAIWSNLVPKKLEKYLPVNIADQAHAIYSNVTLASTGWPMGSPERDAINKSYQETMTTMLTVACCVAAPLMPLSLVMKNYKLNQISQKVKGNVIGCDRRGVEVEQPASA